MNHFPEQKRSGIGDRSVHLSGGDMSLCRLEENDYSDWDRFVESHPNGTPYHLSGWSGFLKEICPQIKARLMVLRCSESDEILAGVPLYEAQSLFFGKRLLSSPFATLGGPLASSSDTLERLMDSMLDEFDASTCGRMEVRGVRSAAPWVGSSGRNRLLPTVESLHHYIDLPETPSELRNGFSKGVRYSISKAQKAEVKIHEDLSDKSIDTFSALHRRTRRRLGLPVYPGNFFRALRDQMPRSTVSFLVARLDGEMIGGLVSLDSGDCVIYEHVADCQRGRKLGVNHLLLWESMQRAIIGGRKTYSMGRTLPDHRGLIQFKRAWGSTEEELSSFCYPEPKSGGDGAGVAGSMRAIARFLFRRLPMPIARWAGAYFYRHWA